MSGTATSSDRRNSDFARRFDAMLAAQYAALEAQLVAWWRDRDPDGYAWFLPPLGTPATSGDPADAGGEEGAT